MRIDTAGRIHWLTPGTERHGRQVPGTAFAFQSFPRLLHDHRIPPRVRDPRYTSQTHRDARLLMAELDDGMLLFAITRYAAFGGLAERVPIGLTTPETLALAAALGARHALLLDGGGSAQLAVRDTAGEVTRWRGFRRVPLGLVATRRTRH